MKLKVQAHLFGVKLSLGLSQAKKKDSCSGHASRTQLRIVEQGLVELETFVVERLADLKPDAKEVKEPTSLGFGFTTVSTEDLDPAEVEEEWFEDEEDEEDWEEE